MDKREEVPLSPLECLFPSTIEDLTWRLLADNYGELTADRSRVILRVDKLYEYGKRSFAAYADSRVQAALAPLRKELDESGDEVTRLVNVNIQLNEDIIRVQSALRDMKRQRDELILAAKKHVHFNFNEPCEICAVIHKTTPPVTHISGAASPPVEGGEKEGKNDAPAV